MTKSKPKRPKDAVELDSVYLLKMLLYLILGAFWVRVAWSEVTEIGIPVGFIIGLILASHEKLQIDRKLEYAILLMAMFIGFWLPIGITIVR